MISIVVSVLLLSFIVAMLIRDGHEEAAYYESEMKRYREMWDRATWKKNRP